MIKLFKNFKYIKYTARHVVEINKLAIKLGAWHPRFLLHDVDKLFMYLFLEKSEASRIHKSKSRHHVRDGKISDPIQAILDWESARFTKPDKPENAREFYTNRGWNIPSLEKAMDDLGL